MSSDWVVGLSRAGAAKRKEKPPAQMMTLYLVERDDVDGHQLGRSAHLQLLVDLQTSLIERVPRVVDLN